jgi:hypothetical protein
MCAKNHLRRPEAKKMRGEEDEEEAALKYKTTKNIQKNYTATAQEKAVSRRRNLGIFRMPLTGHRLCP